MAKKLKHYESLAIVLDDFDIWSGKTSLVETDFKIGDGGELPPAAIANLGNKKIICSTHLRGFNRLKTACRRLLLRHGMPFLNGVAIPVDWVDSVTLSLEQISEEFKSLKDSFLANYDQAIAEWVNSHPDYKDVILKNALSRNEVEKRLNFEYQIFLIQASSNNEHASKLNDKVDGLGYELLDEVAQTASKMYDTHFAGKERCGVRAKSQIKQLRDKIDGLSFLNGHLSALVQVMDSALALFNSAGSDGYVQAPYFYEVASVVLILSQRRTIEQYASGLIGVSDTAQNLHDQAAGTAPTIMVDAGTKSAPQVVQTQPDGESAACTEKNNFALASESDSLSDIDEFFSSVKATSNNAQVVQKQDHTNDSIGSDEAEDQSDLLPELSLEEDAALFF